MREISHLGNPKSPIRVPSYYVVISFHKETIFSPSYDFVDFAFGERFASDGVCAAGAQL